MRVVPFEAIKSLRSMEPMKAVSGAVDAYMAELTWLSESSACDVVVCARPSELDLTDTDEASRPRRGPRGPRPFKPDFHDQLKAAAVFPKVLVYAASHHLTTLGGAAGAERLYEELRRHIRGKP